MTIVPNLDRYDTERLLNKITESRGHWVWDVHSPNARLYFWLDDRNVKPQRLLYEVFVRALAEHEQLHRFCTRDRCVNPEHYEVRVRRPSVAPRA